MLDINGTLEQRGPVVDIYGESRCRDFARKKAPIPNPDVALNGMTRYPPLIHLRYSGLTITADTYAWFFGFSYFYSKWWDPSKHDELRRDEQEAELQEVEIRQIDIALPPLPALPIFDPEASFPANEDEVEPDSEMPKACQQLEELDDHGNPKLVCQFIGEEYDEWVKKLAKPFKSEGGCELS